MINYLYAHTQTCLAIQTGHGYYNIYQTHAIYMNISIYLHIHCIHTTAIMHRLISKRDVTVQSSTKHTSRVLVEIRSKEHTFMVIVLVVIRHLLAAVLDTMYWAAVCVYRVSFNWASLAGYTYIRMYVYRLVSQRSLHHLKTSIVSCM